MLSHSVKLIKKAERKTPTVPTETEFVDANRWSKQFAPGLMNFNRIGATNHCRPSTVCSRTNCRRRSLCNGERMTEGSLEMTRSNDIGGDDGWFHERPLKGNRKNMKSDSGATTSIWMATAAEIPAEEQALEDASRRYLYRRGWNRRYDHCLPAR